MDEDEAERLLRLLKEHYKEPVMPLHRFCNAISVWFRCIERNNTDPELSKGCCQGNEYYGVLRWVEIDIQKSNLLRRMLYLREPLRTEMCPIHKGHWNATAMFEGCPHDCDGTGWLRPRPGSGGDTSGAPKRRAPRTVGRPPRKAVKR